MVYLAYVYTIVFMFSLISFLITGEACENSSEADRSEGTNTGQYVRLCKVLILVNM